MPNPRSLTAREIEGNQAHAEVLGMTMDSVTEALLTLNERGNGNETK